MEPIKDSVFTSLSKLASHTSLFGNVFEANAKLDLLPPSSFPVALFIPPQSYEDSWSESGSLNNSTRIRILFLDRVPEEVDAKASQANEIIEAQLNVSKSFWQTYQEQQEVKEIEVVNSIPLFSNFDATLYGVASEADVNLYIDQPGCFVSDLVARQATVTVSGSSIFGLPSGQAGKSVLIEDNYYTLLTDNTLDGTPGDGTYQNVWYGADFGEYVNQNWNSDFTVSVENEYFLIRTQILCEPSSIFDGNGATFIRTTHSDDPTIEFNPGGDIRASFFLADSITDCTIQNLNARNEGYRKGDPTDVKYYTELNGKPVTYDRRKNKRVNFGSLIYTISTTDINVINCDTWDMNLIKNSDSSGGVIANNTGKGWGEVYIYPPANSLVQNNKGFQDAPVLSQSDINNDLGTSHGMYITSAYDNVTVKDNLIHSARVNGLQLNTLRSSETWDNELLEDNQFVNCFRGFFVGGPLSHVGGDITIRRNEFINCGTLFELICNNVDVTFDDCTFDGNGYARASTGFNRFKTATITKCTFKNRMAFNNDSGLSILLTDEVGQINITDDNTFEQTCNFAIRIENPISAYTKTLTIDNINTFESRIIIGASSGANDFGAGDKIFIDNNIFNITNQAAGVIINMGATLRGNNTFNVVNNTGFVVVNSILNQEAVLDGNNWNGSGLGITAQNSNGNYSMLNNVSNGPTWNKGPNPPNRDINNIGF